jgi:hypothetical protein
LVVRKPGVARFIPGVVWRWEKNLPHWKPWP